MSSSLCCQGSDLAQLSFRCIELNVRQQNPCCCSHCTVDRMGRIHLELSFPSTSEPSQLRADGGNLLSTRAADCRGSLDEQASSNMSRSLQSVEENECGSVPKDLPFQPRYVANEDLPFINAEQVAKMHGKDGLRLCSNPAI